MVLDSGVDAIMVLIIYFLGRFSNLGVALEHDVIAFTLLCLAVSV